MPYFVLLLFRRWRRVLDVFGCHRVVEFRVHWSLCVYETHLSLRNHWH